MVYNVWTISISITFIFLICYCGKKEYFDQVPNVTIYQNSLSKSTGNKYNITEVNKAIKAIVKKLGNISITKIISITKLSNEIIIRLFVYDLTKNVITGYTIHVNVPVTKSKDYTVKSIEKFSKPEELNDFEKTTIYQNLDITTGKFT